MFKHVAFLCLFLFGKQWVIMGFGMSFTPIGRGQFMLILAYGSKLGTSRQFLRNLYIMYFDQGSFGEIRKTFWRGTPIAVKTILPSLSDDRLIV